MMKPPTNGHTKNQLSVGPPVAGRRDHGMRRGSSKNAGEIVIEDQGTATPKYPVGFVSTPQSNHEDQIVFEPGASIPRK